MVWLICLGIDHHRVAGLFDPPMEEVDAKLRVDPKRLRNETEVEHSKFLAAGLVLSG